MIKLLISILEKLRILPPEKTILFVNPDYHCSFFLKDEFRKLGWKADIYKAPNYPENLLFSDDFITLKNIEPGKHGKTIHSIIVRFIFYLRLLRDYKYFLVYSSSEIIKILPECGLFSMNFSPELTLMKLLGKKLVSFPSGCCEEGLKVDFTHYENGRLCNNCGLQRGACSDAANQYSFDLRNRYFDFTIANTPFKSKRVLKHLVRYKSLDIEMYSPEIKVPNEFKLPPSEKLRIMHSFYNKNREYGGKNIKGSPYVVEAIERLKSEGADVEYFFVNDVPSRYMRYYQVQADIVVDQLIYGWWGSTSIECMALGKPVVCHINDELRNTFLEAFPEYNELPIVEADTENIYDVLKELVTNTEYRLRKGRESRIFAEKHFDASKNARELESIFLNIDEYKEEFHPESFSFRAPVSDKKLAKAIRKTEKICRKKKYETVALYGAGRHTGNLLKYKTPGFPKIVCIIDDDLQLREYEGIRVFSPEKFIREHSKDCSCIIISSDVWQDALYEKAKTWNDSGRFEILSLY